MKKFISRAIEVVLLLTTYSTTVIASTDSSQSFRDWNYTTSPSQRVMTLSLNKEAVLTRGGSQDLTIVSASHSRCNETSVMLRFPSLRQEVHLRTECRELSEGGVAYSFVPASRPGFNRYGHTLELMRKGITVEALILSSSKNPDASPLGQPIIFSLRGSSAAFTHLDTTPNPNPEQPYSSDWRTDANTLAALSQKLDSYRETSVKPVFSAAKPSVKPPRQITRKVAKQRPDRISPTECDRLAADPDDNQRIGAPVSWRNLNVEKAVVACRQAITEYPDEPRYPFLLARALSKMPNRDENNNWIGGKIRKERIALYETSIAAGYTSAKIELADMLTRSKQFKEPFQPERIVSLLEEAISEGNGHAWVVLGDYHIDRRRSLDNDSQKDAATKEAYSAWQNALDAGLVAGAVKLAGDTHYSNDDLYLKSLHTAAEMGHARSMVKLGAMYLSGESIDNEYLEIPVDVAKARQWFAAALEADDNYYGMLFLANLTGTHHDGWGNGQYIPVDFDLRDKAWKLAGREDLIAKHSRPADAPANSVGRLSKGALLCDSYKSAMRAAAIVRSGNALVSAASADCDYAPWDLYIMSVKPLQGGVSKVLLESGYRMYTAEHIYD